MGLNYGVSDEEFNKILDEVITEELLYMKLKEYGLIPDFEFNLYESEHNNHVHVSDRKELTIPNNQFYSSRKINLHSFGKQDSYENNYESEDNFGIKKFFSENFSLKSNREKNYVFQGVY